jgi:hypothetical protein
VTTSELPTGEATETFRRARRPEQKQQRRDDILAAARELAVTDGVRAVSLAGIAARAGIDKSALLVADVVARSFGDRPLFCDLLAHTPLNLERNVSADGVRGYKLISLAAVGEAADVVGRVLPDLTEQECLEFIAALASLAGNLWQIANPAPALAALFASDPDLAHACVDLVPRLRRMGEILLAGLIPSRVTGPV